MKKSFNALIVSSYRNFFIKLSPYLDGCGFDAVFHASGIAEAQKVLMTADVSAIIISTPLSDGPGLDFATDCAAKKYYSVLLFAKDELYTQIKEKASPHGIFTLSESTDCLTLSEALLVLVSTAKKLMSLDGSEEKTNSQADRLKLISRAKMILVSSFGMSEEQAHKYIEQRAMEMRKTSAQIAQSIINSYGS